MTPKFIGICLFSSMPQTFNYLRAATVLLEASFKPDKEVAKVFGVGVRTIESWRQRLKTDPLLRQEFKKVSQQKLTRWQTKIPDCLDRAIDFIMKAAEQGNPADPEMVKAIILAITQLNEVLIISEAIEARKVKQVDLN
jgi:hypothetical protein